jgi:hypothetical protein
MFIGVCMRVSESGSRDSRGMGMGMVVRRRRKKEQDNDAPISLRTSLSLYAPIAYPTPTPTPIPTPLPCSCPCLRPAALRERAPLPYVSPPRVCDESHVYCGSRRCACMGYCCCMGTGMGGYPGPVCETEPRGPDAYAGPQFARRATLGWGSVWETWG